MLCAIAAGGASLASILHRMWVSETDFHVGFGAKVTKRLLRSTRSTGGVAEIVRAVPLRVARWASKACFPLPPWIARLAWMYGQYGVPRWVIVEREVGDP